MVKTFNKSLVLLTLLLLISSCKLLLATVVITTNLRTNSDQEDSSKILSQVYLYEDSSGVWNIHDTQAKESQFKLVDSDHLDTHALGLSGSSWWLRLHLNTELIKNPSYLMLDFSLLEEVELYISDGNGGFIVQKAGIASPNQYLGLMTRFPVFSLDSLRHDEPIYLKVKSQGPILLPIFIKEVKQYFSDELANNLLFGMFFGIMLLVLCYNIILYRITQEAIYFHYFIYVFFICITIMNYFGFSYSYFWPKNIIWISKVMPICIMLVVISMINFMRHYLNTKVNFSFIDKILQLTIVFYILMLLTLPFFPTYIYFRLIAPGSPIMMILFIPVLIKSYKKSFAPATYMLIGWFFVLFGIITMVGKTFGLIPYNRFTTFAIIIGIIVEVIMFTIGIAYRFRWLKNETKQVKDELAAKHFEIETLHNKVADYIMGASHKASALPITISKDEINGYLLNQLTERELDVIYHVAEGLSNKDISEQLFISTNTVRAHMRNIYDKLRVKNRTQAVFKANQLQLILSK